MAHQCNCGATHNEEELGIQYNLYQKIDIDNIECLNEYEENSGKTVFKVWEERLSTDKFVESDADDEILFNIPFTGNIKLKGLIIIGGEGYTHPNKVRLFKNRPYMTFDDVAIEADQELELYKDSSNGVHEYPLKAVKFPSVNHLSLHFTGNGGAERTKIYYIGMKGEWSPAHQHGVTICTYEARPLASDHPNEFDNMHREIS
ncbi:PITH domain-containing protein GA19395 [Prorops nasuta]|uniref:PITH domain-containing protein GA19395 n=1 Tax=Prorops nasuta TaxID=863751 RepID=UPI0034CDED9A